MLSAAQYKTTYNNTDAPVVFQSLPLNCSSGRRRIDDLLFEGNDFLLHVSVADSHLSTYLARKNLTHMNMESVSVSLESNDILQGGEMPL